ncbi:MAG TPA: metallophosphoesterase [Acetobacteraceae bacterium]|nr:metallophosphoesterase [Acetobacteraceae bacterium]
MKASLEQAQSDTEPKSGAPESGRRRVLECMAWAGTGVLWTVVGGIPRSRLLGNEAEAAESTASFRFIQISDSHLGFHGAANPDVAGTLRQAIAEVKVNADQASFLIHTGDVSHTSQPAQFDAAAMIIQEAGLTTHFVPGEHDVIGDAGKGYFTRFGVGKTRWYSFDERDVHFVGLDNVSQLGVKGLGHLGADQLAWLRNDLAGRSRSQPIVVMAHIPLWQIYPQWGWGTEEAAELLAMLRPFGSVTVLNGHIHQIIQKVEGQVAFHTARSTAFPQAAPSPEANPGPLTVPAGRLEQVLGTAGIQYVPGRARLAIIDTPLGA